MCRISTTASFASQFLVPRLHLFRDRFPEIELEFLTTIRLVDLSREEFDIAIRYGGGHYAGLEVTRLMSETVLPVCAPGLLAELGELLR